MQPGRAGRFKLLGDQYGVVGVDGLPLVITLAQTNDLTVSQVNGRDYFHDIRCNTNFSSQYLSR
jgi:hypothetical protein